MIWLLRDFDLLAVVLRGIFLALESITLGGVAFLLLVALPSNPKKAAEELVVRSCRHLIRSAALGLAIIVAASVSVSTASLMGSSSLPLHEFLSASYFITGVISIAACVGIVFCASRPVLLAQIGLVAFSLLVLSAAVFTSHALSRMEDRTLLAALTAAHHLGAALWLGALPSLLVAMKAAKTEHTAGNLLKRFSPMALTGASLLLFGGVGMAWFYLGNSGAERMIGLYGTTYGVMLLAKIYLFLLIVTLGAGNFFVVRRFDSSGAGFLLRLRRFSEVEIGLAFTALLAAASMTSQSPAVDVPQDRVNVREIVQQFHPQWPRLTSPPLTALAPATSLQTALQTSAFTGESASDVNDRAWSEYNHHWAGLIVLAAGLLALASRSPRAKWARNWPVVFAALAVFILLRADPECWPLGPRPFWGSFSYPDVLQHRFFAVLILAFAAFEWGVQTGRIRALPPALVFPGLCAIGGAVLLTHSHAMGDMRKELLAEMSHIAVALLGAAVGWGRWLEVRLPDDRRSRLVTSVWPVCLALAGMVLLNYREC